MSSAISVSQFEKSLNNRFDGLFELRQRDLPEPFPTGIPEIDQLISGGIPRATLTEIRGGPSSGRTSLLISVLAQSTSNGHFCALIDGSDTFDPVSAETAGVQLSQLLWVRCGGNTENALKATDLIVQAGGFGLVVIDLGDIPERQAGRISLTSWFRLRHAAGHNGATLIVIERQFNASSCSKLQLELRRERSWWSVKRLKGLVIEAHSHKRYNRRSASFRIAS